jgi:YtfJ family uncharacterized protein
MKTIFLLFCIIFSLHAIQIGKKPKEITISGENGGYVKDNKAWNSNMIQGKVFVMFYVDPDEKDKNEHFAQALKKRHFDRDKYASIAIVNMAATWKPNFIIESILESKQKEFTDTIYVKDKKSVLVNGWNLADNESDILIFDKDGKVLFYKAGKMTQDDVKKAISIIEEHL